VKQAQSDFKEGQLAQRGGIPIVKNPFRAAARQRAWIDGWLDSFYRAPWQPPARDRTLT